MRSQPKIKSSVAYAKIGRASDKNQATDSNNLSIFKGHRGRTINQQILSHMNEDHRQYIKSLSKKHHSSQIDEGEREESTMENDRSTRKIKKISTNDQSFDSIRVNSKIKSKFFCESIHERESRFEQTEMSRQMSPVSNDSVNRSEILRHQPDYEDDASHFVLFLDSYIDKLTNSGQPHYHRQSQTHVKLLKKLQKYENKLKQMQLHYHLELKKMKTRDMSMRMRIGELQDHVQQLESQLQEERQSKKSFEALFSQFHQKMRNFKKPHKQFYDSEAQPQYNHYQSYDYDKSTKVKKKGQTTTEFKEDERNQIRKDFFRTKRMLEQNQSDDFQDN